MGSAILVAAAVGAAIAAQVGIIGRAAGRFDVLAISMILQVGGLAGAVVWMSARSGWGQLVSLGRTWWWLPLGIVGWVIVAGLGFASARIGVAAVLAVSVASQLVTGLAMDTTSGIPVGGRGLAGAVLLVTGAVLIAHRS